MQKFWRWKIGDRPTGAVFVAGMTLFLVLYVVSFFYIRQIKNQNGANWGFWRNQIVSNLARDGHKHLVLVHYSPGHNENQEWVYNGAQWDTSPVLWARDMGLERNRELLDYFKDRVIWEFDPDLDAKPQAYPDTVGSKSGRDSI
jgi:hypothetical protein